MTSIQTIQESDLISSSRADINQNFENLNDDKMETSVLDTDSTLAANSDEKVASQKAVKSYVDAQSLLNIEVETAQATTHSLTTDGTQKVIVWAKGTLDPVNSQITNITLKYNGVQKDVVQQDSSGSTDPMPFALMYTETPTASTQNVTIEHDNGGGSITNPVIIIMKI